MKLKQLIVILAIFLNSFVCSVSFAYRANSSYPEIIDEIVSGQDPLDKNEAESKDEDEVKDREDEEEFEEEDQTVTEEEVIEDQEEDQTETEEDVVEDQEDEEEFEEEDPTVTEEEVIEDQEEDQTTTEEEVDKDQIQDQKQLIKFHFGYEKTIKQFAGKPVVLVFSATDWCYWCAKMEDEILLTEEFSACVGDKFVFIKCDFSHHSPETTEEMHIENDALKDMFKIYSIPTLIVLDENLNMVGRFYHLNIAPKEYAKMLLKTLE